MKCRYKYVLECTVGRHFSQFSDVMSSDNFRSVYHSVFHFLYINFFFSPTFTIIRALGLNTSILYRIDKNVRVHDNKTISNNVLIIKLYIN